MAPPRLEVKFELDFALKVAVGLRQNLALDVVCAKDGLFQLHVAKSHEREAETLQGLALPLVDKDLAMGGQIESANL